MKVSQFTQEQIIAILQQAERGEQTIGALCREHGIAEVTFYRWRKKYGGMTVPEAHRLRELERENARLKRLLAERDLEVDVLKEALRKNGGPLPSFERVPSGCSRAASPSAAPARCWLWHARPHGISNALDLTRASGWS